MPINIRLMGAYQMCSTLKDRWNYLYRIYFHQKKNIIYVDDTKSYLKLSNQFEHHNQVADYFLGKTNALFNKINDILK